MTTRQQRDSALLLIASTGRRSVDEVNEVGSTDVTQGLISQRLIERDATGGLVLTDMGTQRVDMLQNPY